MTDLGTSSVVCPECGESMRRERRLIVQGHTPFRCANGHMVVDDAEPIVSDHAGFVITRADTGRERLRMKP